MLRSFQHEYGRKILARRAKKVKKKVQSPQFLHKIIFASWNYHSPTFYYHSPTGRAHKPLTCYYVVKERNRPEGVSNERPEHATFTRKAVSPRGLHQRLCVHLHLQLQVLRREGHRPFTRNPRGYQSCRPCKQQARRVCVSPLQAHERYKGSYHRNGRGHGDLQQGSLWGNGQGQ